MADQRSALGSAEVCADSSAAELLRGSLPGASVSASCTGMPLSLAHMYLCFMLGATHCAAVHRMSSHADAAVVSTAPAVHRSCCAGMSISRQSETMSCTADWQHCTVCDALWLSVIAATVPALGHTVCKHCCKACALFSSSF